MIKSTKTSDVEPLLIDATPRVAPARPSMPIEGLYCFVDTDELRRLVCMMAGTELLSELLQTLSGVKSAREVPLPPTLL